MRQLRRRKRLWRRSLTRSHKKTSMGLPEVVGAVQQVHCNWRRLLRRGVEFHAFTINESAHTKKSVETYLMILVYIYIYIYRCKNKKGDSNRCDTTKQSISEWQYICSPPGVELSRERTKSCHLRNAKLFYRIEQLVIVSVKCKQMPTFNSFALKILLLALGLLVAVMLSYQSDEKLVGFLSQLKESHVSSHIDELWYHEVDCLSMTIYID